MLYNDNLIVIFLVLTGLVLASYIACSIDNNSFLIISRSKCNNCKKNLSFFELVPIISYLLLKGKCRNCKYRIPKIYIYYEFFFGIILPITWYFSNYSDYIIKLLEIILVILLLYLFYLDWKRMLIDLRILMLIVIIFLLILFINTTSIYIIIYDHILGGLVGGSFLLIIRKVYKLTKEIDGMGAGDPYLSAVLGFVYQLELIMIIITISAILGIIYYLIANSNKTLDFKKRIPYGSFLILAAFFISYSEKLFYFTL